jgi:hypothetical protein
MKTLKLILLLAAVGCTHDDKDCIDLSKKKDGMCYEIYQPVCGCNGQTYSNDCFASAAGVKTWTKGACE